MVSLPPNQPASAAPATSCPGVGGSDTPRRRGRALLRQYSREPEAPSRAEEAAEAEPAKLPPMQGNATLSAPVRGDLAAVVASLEATPAETPAVKHEARVAPTPQPEPLMRAASQPEPEATREKMRRRRQGRTMVPSALDGHARHTISSSHDSVDMGAWYREDPEEDWVSELSDAVAQEESLDLSLDDLDGLGLDDQPGEAMPRVLAPGVELTVFFVGLTLGLAVQGTVAAVAWMALGA